MYKPKIISVLLLVFFAINTYSVKNISYCIKSPTAIIAGETYNVNIVIHKDDIKGSSKFEVRVPDGFTIEAKSTSGAFFTFNDNTAKFIWVLIPKTETVELSYNITVSKDFEGSKRIFRKFSYIDNNKRQEQKFYSIISAIDDKLLSNTPNLNTENNIEFKVQIGAFLNKPTVIKRYNSIKNNYTIEETFINNYYKYFVGSFLNIEQANNFKATCKINGAFITAYSNGKQISIEEAINLTNK